ncbi:MAG: serine/threonine protein kinase [Acidobacteria bacterium]|nr:serine/threonine protein kinase [Acidobacteriota bacterium]
MNAFGERRDPEVWRQAGDIFEAALLLPDLQRRRYIERATAGDGELGQRVLAMLEANAQEFLERPICKLGEECDGLRSADLRRVGPFELLRPLGRGGMGEVFLARQRDPVNRLVALKVVRQDLGKGLVRRFLAESSLLAQIEHPNVARLYDAGNDGGTPYLVMELVDGPTLLEHSRREGLSVLQRVELFRQVCAGVQAAHAKLLIHRDLKPANILVASDGTAKLLDFGVAQLLDPQTGAARRPRAGSGFLTPRYASPEQLQGLALDTRSDVYSLGVVLHELLVGESPYGSSCENRRELENAVCQDFRRPAGLGEDLDSILLRALAKDPAQRYNSVEALSEDLRRWQALLPVAARPPSILYRARKFLLRHRMGVTASAAGALLLLSFAFLHWARLAQHAREMDRQRARAEEVSGLLVEMLSTVGGSGLQDSRVEAGDLLSAGIRQIGATKAQEPAVQASLLHTIGRVFHRLGRDREAEESLLRSLKLHRSARVISPEDLADTLELLGRVQRELGKLNLAGVPLEEALEIRRPLQGRRPDRLADVLQELGILSWDRLDFTRAESFFREALSIRQQSNAEDPSRLHHGIFLLARVTGDSRLLDQAAQWLASEVEAQRALLGPGHPQVAQTLIDLGDLASRRGDRHRAEVLFAQAHQLLEEALGGDHPLTDRCLRLWASALAWIGRYEEAESLFRATLSTARKHLPEDHPEILFSLHNLAVVVSHQGKFEQAHGLFQQALAGVRRRFPENPCKAGPTLFSLARHFHHRGLLAEAEAAFRQAEESCRDRADEESFLPTALGLAFLRFDQGRIEEAQRRILAELARVEDPGAVDGALLAEAEGLAGACSAALGPTREGVLRMQVARDLLRRQRGETYPVVLWLDERIRLEGSRLLAEGSRRPA